MCLLLLLFLLLILFKIFIIPIIHTSLPTCWVVSFFVFVKLQFSNSTESWNININWLIILNESVPSRPAANHKPPKFGIQRIKKLIICAISVAVIIRRTPSYDGCDRNGKYPTNGELNRSDAQQFKKKQGIRTFLFIQWKALYFFVFFLFLLFFLSFIKSQHIQYTGSPRIAWLPASYQEPVKIFCK